VNCPNLVCPDDHTLIQSLTGRELVVLVNEPDRVSEAAVVVGDSGNQLTSLMIEYSQPLDRFPFREEWQGLPMALFVPELGRFSSLVEKLQLIRAMDLCVYLPAASADNLCAMRILASVGVKCAAVFGRSEPDWEALADLMTYAVLGRIRHAPIEPFTHIAANYHPQDYTPWGAIYFDDPRHFLHLDGAGRVALSAMDREAGKFLGIDIHEVVDPSNSPTYLEGVDSWRNALQELSACSTCPGWRVCLGRLGQFSGGGRHCSKLFAEMMEVAEIYRSKLHNDPQDDHRGFGGDPFPEEVEVPLPC